VKKEGIMKRKHLMAMGLTLVLAVFLAGHISPAGGQARAEAGDSVSTRTAARSSSSARTPPQTVRS
jgi:hypothetical protein